MFDDTFFYTVNKSTWIVNRSRKKSKKKSKSLTVFFLFDYSSNKLIFLCSVKKKGRKIRVNKCEKKKKKKKRMNLFGCLLLAVVTWPLGVQMPQTETDKESKVNDWMNCLWCKEKSEKWSKKKKIKWHKSKTCINERGREWERIKSNFQVEEKTRWDNHTSEKSGDANWKKKSLVRLMISFSQWRLVSLCFRSLFDVICFPVF